MSKTTTLHVHHAFLCISLQSLYVYSWTRARALLFSSNPKSLILNNCWAPWNNHEKSERMWSLFSATFSRTWLSSDRKVPNMKSGRMSVKSDFVSYLLGRLINGPVAINGHMVQNRDVLKRGTVKKNTTLNCFLYHSEVGRGSRESP